MSDDRARRVHRRQPANPRLAQQSLPVSARGLSRPALSVAMSSAAKADPDHRGRHRRNGSEEKIAGLKTCLVALIANGLSPLRLLKSWWSGAELDELRNGPLDKHGAGSRILDVTARSTKRRSRASPASARTAPDPAGGTERGLTSRKSRPT